MVSVKWSADAVRDLRKLDKVIAERAIEKSLWLERNYSKIVPAGLRRDFKGQYKLRVGDYRMIYSVHGNVVTIEAVGDRRDIYK